MRTFKMVNGDFSIVGGRMAMVDGDDEILQSVWMIINTNLGEWFLNPGMGFPRFEVLGGKYPETTVQDKLSRAILLSEPRIASVDDLNVTFDRPGRKIEVSFTVTKTDGGIVTQNGATGV